MKRQPLKWEKIIANKATDKEFISKIYKQLMQLNTRKMKDPIKSWNQIVRRNMNYIFLISISIRYPQICR